MRRPIRIPAGRKTITLSKSSSREEVLPRSRLRLDSSNYGDVKASNERLRKDETSYDARTLAIGHAGDAATQPVLRTQPIAIHWRFTFIGRGPATGAI
jgi:hypothetical protein